MSEDAPPVDNPMDYPMEHVRLYNDLAYLWPVISPSEDYAEEAVHWLRAIEAQLGPGPHDLLELGVGGGHNLSHLTPHHRASAVDVSPRMLALSRRLNPEVDHHLGDMRTVRLGRKFDAVLFHDAISYMLTEEDLRAAFETARAHLRPDGLVLVAPDLVAESFREGAVIRWESSKGSVTVATEERLHDPDPADTQVDSWFTYQITEGGSKRVERDVHVTGLFPIGLWTSLLAEAGFEVELIPLPGQEGFGEWLFSGVLPAGGAVP